MTPVSSSKLFGKECEIHYNRLICPSKASIAIHCGVWFYGNGTLSIKEGLYIIWCGVNTLGVSGVNTLGDTSAFVNPTVRLLLTRRSKFRMNGVGIVFEFYIAPL